jgi:polar amino acid transport system permease protein
MMVLIFFIALVAVPQCVDGLKAFGVWLTGNGMGAIGGVFSSMNGQQVPMNTRAVAALALTYGAFLAEIFRAGIQSIPKGQMEAARALGLTYPQALRYVILPQAIKNVLPALGNDFISMLKDSSLVSILAVRDITQISRLYASSSFRFNEAYTILAVFYLVMTVGLSLLVKALEKRMETGKAR